MQGTGDARLHALPQQTDCLRRTSPKASSLHLTTQTIFLSLLNFEFEFQNSFFLILPLFIPFKLHKPHSSSIIHLLNSIHFPFLYSIQTSNTTINPFLFYINHTIFKPHYKTTPPPLLFFTTFIPFLFYHSTIISIFHFQNSSCLHVQSSVVCVLRDNPLTLTILYSEKTTMMLKEPNTSLSMNVRLFPQNL